MEKKPIPELNLVILPKGALHMEWMDTKNAIPQSSRLLQTEIHDRFSEKSDLWLLSLGFSDLKIPLPPSLDYWRRFSGSFAEKLVRTPDLEILRHRVSVPVVEDLEAHLASAPMMTGVEYLKIELLEALWARLNKAFSRAIQSYQGSVEAFIRTYSPDIQLVGRVFFHLVENKSEEFPFAFMATYTTRLNRRGKSKHLPLKHALTEYEDDNEKLLELLATVHAAEKRSPLMGELLETGELFHPLGWTAEEAFTFLKEIPIYEESGILCRIPNWWKGKQSGVRLNFSLGDKKPSLAGLDAILSFNAQLFLGDMQISEAEARRLLAESEGLAFIKNRWVAVDREKLTQTLDAYEKAGSVMEKEGLSLREAMRMQLMPERFFDLDPQEIDHGVSNGKWLESMIQKLANPSRVPAVKPNKTFTARLRGYQQKGLNWLYFLHSLKFGACLADDMGLGKTIQVLGFLNIIKSDLQKSKKPNKASLLIIPASLISNWENEIKRFSPDIRFLVAHPSSGFKTGSGGKTKTGSGLKNGESPEALDSFDLIITTYALVQRYAWLHDHPWKYIILDEAQAIKNPGTKQSRAVKKLISENRIIMTGTPIENRLSDIWSLFDFLNPGLLGNVREFKKFSKSLDRDSSGYAKLRNIISPYILRRLKTDKSVISDLPEKVEMKTYAPLAKKQVLLYGKLVRDIRKSLEETEGIQRKGLILSSLMKFKQICNHPDQYLGSGGFEEKESGKFQRLREICATIYEKREKVLIFTQFKEMTQPLHDLLSTVFQGEGLILHGSVAVGKRKKIIEQFQSADYIPFMVLSLKAGGIGLNLTEANHVVHFDRWWNPAVENQATDRAFRIGQKKNVVVHKFLTKGTVEEKIDMMLEEKSRLSEEIIASTGDGWITEMKNDELLEMFKLAL